METHKNLLDNMEHWLQQDASLLAMTNEVDYDQDGEQDNNSDYKSEVEGSMMLTNLCLFQHMLNNWKI